MNNYSEFEKKHFFDFFFQVKLFFEETGVSNIPRTVSAPSDMKSFPLVQNSPNRGIANLPVQQELRPSYKRFISDSPDGANKNPGGIGLMNNDIDNNEDGYASTDTDTDTDDDWEGTDVTLV